MYPVYGALLNADQSPTYEIVFIVQWISGFVLYTITIACCSLAATFALHTCGQFKIVIQLLQELTSDNLNTNNLNSTIKRINDNLADIVERHLRALKYNMSCHFYISQNLYPYYIVYVLYYFYISTLVLQLRWRII